MEVSEISVEDLKRIAREKYTQGGDVPVECWDDKTYENFIRDFPKDTQKQFLNLLRTFNERENWR